MTDHVFPEDTTEPVPDDEDCPHCGGEHPAGWSYCPHFGEPLPHANTPEYKSRGEELLRGEHDTGATPTVADVMAGAPYLCPGCWTISYLTQEYDPDVIDLIEIECGECEWEAAYDSDGFDTVIAPDDVLDGESDGDGGGNADKKIRITFDELASGEGSDE